jgi:hypothetical protein
MEGCFSRVRRDPRRCVRAVPAIALGLFLALFLFACAEDGTPAPELTAIRPAPTQFVLPTLYPTATSARQQPTPTREMPATRAPEATADLKQTAVAFHYTIPALGLDRRLEANVAGTVTVVDEAAGLAATLSHQGGVLFELQTALPELELAELPEGCQGCVAFSYSLPLSGEEGSGWLQDPVMLASVENYLALTLGPHWPAGTIAGLRRSASPYHVSHTVALTSGGELYRWRATVPEVSGAEEGSLPPLPSAEAELAAEYRVICPGAPLETLFIDRGAEDGEGGASISILCPAFSLPATLVPLYVTLDELLAPLLDEEELAVPPSDIPLSTMVGYEKAGTGRILLLDGDQALLVDQTGEVLTSTLAAGTVVSMTAALEDSGVLKSGVDAYTTAEAAHILMVRTATGMAEVAWDETPPAALEPALLNLESIWEQALPASTATATPPEEATPDPTASP